MAALQISVSVLPPSAKILARGAAPHFRGKHLPLLRPHSSTLFWGNAVSFSSRSALQQTSYSYPSRPRRETTRVRVKNENEDDAALPILLRKIKEQLSGEPTKQTRDGGEVAPVEAERGLTGWDVPWGGWQVAGTMFSWAISFVLVGGLFVPLAGRSLGYNVLTMEGQDKAMFLLVMQAFQTATGLGIIYLSTAKYRPLPDDLFVYSVDKPWGWRDGWLTWGLIGYAGTFGVIAGISALVSALGMEDVSSQSTLDQVSDLFGAGATSILSLLLVTSLFAPLLEETVFRGFLLTSLTKWLPLPVAIAISSVAFALAHFAPKDFFQLAALGCLLGYTYTRTKNLYTPMVIHSLWNSGVVILLLVLQSQGLDVNELIHS